MLKIAMAFGLLSATMLAAVSLMQIGDTNPVAADNGGMEAMSIDVDPTGNTATTLGERDECIEVAPGDDVVVDVTALDIPASDPMFGFNYGFEYDADNMSVTAADHGLLLASLPGSAPSDASDGIPDSDGLFIGGSIDLTATPETSESGSGVLSRLTVSVDAGAPAGGYSLVLTGESIHLDPLGAAFFPHDLFAAQLAVGVTCASLPPPPTPPAFAKGDNDCDGDTDSVDALQGLRSVAGLPVSQEPGCPAFGSEVNSIFGDMDCDDDVDSIDSLFILRDLVGFTVNLPGGCTPIGE